MPHTKKGTDCCFQTGHGRKDYTSSCTASWAHQQNRLTLSLCEWLGRDFVHVQENPSSPGHFVPELLDRKVWKLTMWGKQRQKYPLKNLWALENILLRGNEKKSRQLWVASRREKCLSFRLYWNSKILADTGDLYPQTSVISRQRGRWLGFLTKCVFQLLWWKKNSGEKTCMWDSVLSCPGITVSDISLIRPVRRNRRDGNKIINGF